MLDLCAGIRVGLALVNDTTHVNAASILIMAERCTILKLAKSELLKEGGHERPALYKASLLWRN
jgi:hypothetical protein